MNSQRRFAAAPRAAARATRILSLLALSVGLMLRAGVAHADVSSWVFVGGGAAQLQQRALSSRAVGTMRVQFGLGTDPSHPLVLGGLFSFEPNFGYGSDLALLVRGATRGYVNGEFGLALDAGPYERFWGQRSVGGASMLWLGAPWGIGLGLGANLGSHDASGFSAIVGIDFARLTVYRTAGTSWFPNPFPAYRAPVER